MHFKMKSGKLKEKRSIARCVPQAGEAMENKCVIKNSKTVDLFLFMGQSNMAGRGIVSEKWAQPAPQIMEGAGYEYRAISAPDKLYPLTEPFGRQENAEDGINDGNMKTGSLVTAFVNACYQKTGVPIVGVSASKGGSSILQWQPGTPYLSDTLRRLAKARRFLAYIYAVVPGRDRWRSSYDCRGLSKLFYANVGTYENGRRGEMLSHTDWKI